MKSVLAIAALASLTLAPLSAIAGPYEDAVAIGVSPVTTDEMLTCSHYWGTWAASLDPNFYGEGKGIWDAGWLSTLNPAIQLPAAEETAKYWDEQAFAKLEAEGNVDEYDAFWEEAYAYDVQSLNERKFMQLLGECARPD